MTKSKSGFTIVELLIVIVVIGILAAITIVAYNGIQARAHDTQRDVAIKNVRKQLEMYYIDKGYYPTTGQIIGPNTTWLKTNMPDIANGTVIAPGAPIGTINSFTTGGSAITPINYSYYSLTSTGDVCTTEGDCTDYRLAWRSEATNAITGYAKL